MSKERDIVMPPSDHVLFLKFQEEVGKLDSLTITELEGVDRWYNQDLESSEMAIKAIVRGTTLKRIGFQEENWIVHKDNIASSLEDLPEVKFTLGEPNFKHYKWQKVSAINKGNFADLQRNFDIGPIIDARSGVVLFSDEVQQLEEGQTVTTFHSSGFGMGFLAEKKEAYRVIDGNLQRVRATITD